MHVWLRLLKTKLLKLLKGSSGPQEETFQRFLRASFGIVNCLPLGSAFLFLSDRFHYWLFQHQLPWQSPQEVFCHRARATSPGRGNRMLFPECLKRRQVTYTEHSLVHRRHRLVFYVRD